MSPRGEAGGVTTVTCYTAMTAARKEMDKAILVLQTDSSRTKSQPEDWLSLACGTLKTKMYPTFGH